MGLGERQEKGTTFILVLKSNEVLCMPYFKFYFFQTRSCRSAHKLAWQPVYLCQNRQSKWSVNLFEQTCVKFSLKNNARMLHWQDCRGIQWFYYPSSKENTYTLDGCLGCFPLILFISGVSVKPRREQLSNKLSLSRWIFWVVGITRLHCPVSWNSCSAPCFSLSGPGLFGPETLLPWPLFALVTCMWLWPSLLSEGCLILPALLCVELMSSISG